MLPRPHISEQKSRHLPLLDLLAAFGDAVAAVVAVDVLERLVTRIAHAAMHLHGALSRAARAMPRSRVVLTGRAFVGDNCRVARIRFEDGGKPN
jgi:hypothetical protein